MTVVLILVATHAAALVVGALGHKWFADRAAAALAAATKVVTK